MNYCPNCGSALKENPSYCPNCGRKITSDEADRKYTTMGTPITKNEQKPASDEDSEIKERNKRRIKKEMGEAKDNAIALGIAAVVLIIGGISFLGQRVASAELFDLKVVLIDQSAIGGVVAIIAGIACAIGATNYEKKYKELKDKL